MDSETKQVLAMICEVLLADIKFSIEIHKSTVALLRSALDEPTLNERYKKHWESLLHEVPEPVSPEVLQRLAQLQQLTQQLKS